MENLSELLGKASTPGDTAVILLAGTLGFTLDAGLNLVGFLSPGYTGITFASTALGLKKAAEATVAQRRRRRQLWDRAQRLLFLFRAAAAHEEAAGVQREIEILDGGLRSLDASEAALNLLTDRYVALPIVAKRTPAL